MITVYDVANLVRILYWGAMWVALGGALLLIFTIGPRQYWKRVAAVLSALVVIPGAFHLYPRAIIWREENKPEVRAARERYETAKALFDEQCKRAGEKIYRTVEGVEGVMLLKVREDSPGKSYYESKRDPMWPDAAAWDFHGEAYIENFLKTWANIHNTTKDRGYPYVDVLQQNGSIVRYTETEDGDLVEAPNPAHPARYAITYTNNVDPALRKYWIAGTTIQIVDRQTNELLAEKTVFVFDSGLGDTYMSRTPWHNGNIEICPHALEHERRTIDFVDKVLISIFPAEP